VECAARRLRTGDAEGISCEEGSTTQDTWEQNEVPWKNGKIIPWLISEVFWDRREVSELNVPSPSKSRFAIFW
jgi:hypothetical protein